MLLWHTWSVHNKMIHEGASPFIASSVTFLTRYMSPLSNIWQQGDYIDSKGKHSLAPVTSNTQVRPTVQRSKRWVSPPQGSFKISVDVVFNPLSWVVVVGVVIRDWQGSLELTASCIISHCGDAEEAKARACLESVHMDLRWLEIPMILESNCQTVVAKCWGFDFTRERSPRTLKSTYSKVCLQETTSEGKTSTSLRPNRKIQKVQGWR
jgi:hypothetical protein